MEEADFLCDKIAIMDKGEIATIDTPMKLKDSLGGDVVDFEVGNDIDKLMDSLKKIDWIKRMRRHQSLLNVTVDRAENKIPKIIKFAEQKSVDIISVNMHKPSLEDVFLHFTGKTIREQEADSKEMRKARFRRMRRARR